MFPWYLQFSWRDIYLVLPILLSSCNSLHCSLKKAFLPLLANLWNSAFSWIYFYLSPLPFVSLLSSAICKVSSDNHFVFLHFFLFGMVLATASGTVLQTSIHSSSGTLSVLIPWICLLLWLYNLKGFDLGRTWMVWWFSYFLQHKSDFGNKEVMIWVIVS